MSNHTARVARLETQVAPPQSIGLGFIDRNLVGECTAVTLNGNRLQPIGTESESAMRTRAIEAAGCPDHVIWVVWGNTPQLVDNQGEPKKCTTMR